MNTRYDLAKMITADGLLIELGVAAGKSANGFLLSNPAVQYIGIDRWSDHHDLDEMATAQDRVAWHDKALMICSTFDNALQLFEDGSADMIYIDGYAHTGQDNGKTLDDWWPKLKSVGIFSGHDYHPEYQPTIDAVNAFAAKHGLTLNIIEDQANKYPSWWVRKP